MGSEMCIRDREMRLYENDIQTTLIEDFARKEKEMDVDKQSPYGSHRT